MLDLQTINALSAEAALKAARDKVEPFIVTAEDIRLLKTGAFMMMGGRFPFLGDHVPDGWRRTEREPLFCDMTGMGRAGEPALTLEQLASELTAGLGYATIEQGQFQCHLAEYEREEAVEAIANNRAELVREIEDTSVRLNMLRHQLNELDD